MSRPDPSLLCIRFQCKASDLATAMLDELKEKRFSEYSKVKRFQMTEFDHYDSMVTGLKAIAEIKCEVPCRLGGDGCGGSCEIIRCVKDKAFEGCWECGEFETCNKLDFLKPFHGNAVVKNLRKIREWGIESWAKHSEKFYPWL